MVSVKIVILLSDFSSPDDKKTLQSFLAATASTPTIFVPEASVEDLSDFPVGFLVLLGCSATGSEVLSWDRNLRHLFASWNEASFSEIKK